MFIRLSLFLIALFSVPLLAVEKNHSEPLSVIAQGGQERQPIPVLLPPDVLDPAKNLHSLCSKNPQDFLRAQKVVFCDLETTGLNHLDGKRITEIGAILTENGVPVQTLHLLLNPGSYPSDANAGKSVKLEEARTRAQAPFHKAARQLEDFFSQGIFCAYNGRVFDHPYLMAEMTRARAFFYLKAMIDPSLDLKEEAPVSVHFDSAKALLGHKILVQYHVIDDTPGGAQVNVDHVATDLASAAMMYIHRDYMSKDRFEDGTPGPMIFRDGKILPDHGLYPNNYRAAIQQLMWYRLIRSEGMATRTIDWANLNGISTLQQPIQSSLQYLGAVQKIFQLGYINHGDLTTPLIAPVQVFDPLVFLRDCQSKDSPYRDRFIRGFNLPTLSLDNVLDYYNIPRYLREAGGHSGALDTMLLFQAVRKMTGFKDAYDCPWAALYKANDQQKVLQYLFRKNSISKFNVWANRIEIIGLHNDQIPESSIDFFSLEKKTARPASENRPRPVRQAAARALVPVIPVQDPLSLTLSILSLGKKCDGPLVRSLVCHVYGASGRVYSATARQFEFSSAHGMTSLIKGTGGQLTWPKISDAIGPYTDMDSLHAAIKRAYPKIPATVVDQFAVAA